MTTNTTSITDGLPTDRPRFLTGLSRTNRYAGECRVCRQTVPAERGHIARLRTGSWVVQHASLDACRAAFAARAARPGVERPAAWTPERGEVHVLPAGADTAGAVRVGERTIIFVRVSYRQNGSGWYVNRWDGWSWEYAPHLRSQIAPATTAGAEHAAAFGSAFSRCVFCTRNLDTAESITVGYGPDCAAQRGLPWGNVSNVRPVTRPATNPGLSATDIGTAIADGGACGSCGEEFSTRWESLRENHPCGSDS